MSSTLDCQWLTVEVEAQFCKRMQSMPVVVEQVVGQRSLYDAAYKWDLFWAATAAKISDDEDSLCSTRPLKLAEFYQKKINALSKTMSWFLID